MVCSAGRFYGKVFALNRFAAGNQEMPALARKLEPPPPLPEPKLRTFHATVLVTRLEEWWVEAESAEEARTLLAAGEGHRSASGACVHVELERLHDH